MKVKILKHVLLLTPMVVFCPAGTQSTKLVGIGFPLVQGGLPAMGAP